MLSKWFIEISRNFFQENLREKQALFENPTEAAIYYRNGQTLDADAKTHGTCPTPCFDERG